MGNSATKPQTSMSNSQMQTRGMSASDFIRMKKLRAMRQYYTSQQTSYQDSVVGSNKDINTPPTPQVAYKLPMHHFKTVGTSKIRRPASDWTAFKASQTMDFPTHTNNVPTFDGTIGTQQYTTRLCDCNNYVLNTKVAGCTKCTVNTKEPLPNCNTSAPEGVTCVVDLAGITFDGTGNPGHRYDNKFFLGSGQTTITFGLMNAGCSNLDQITHIQFDTYDADGGSILSGSDLFTITNPSYGPAGTFGTIPGVREYLYDNNTYSITPSSVFTLTTTNPLSIISFTLN